MSEIECNIESVEIRQLTRFKDQRGWLAELFRQDEIDENTYPVMSYISMTKAGISRGPHEHKYQTDYICFLGISKFEVYLWDNRPDSPTFGNDYQFIVEKNVIVRVKIPPGVVHAYKNIGDNDGLVFNSPDKLYAGENRNNKVDEIRYEDSPDSKFEI